MGNAGFTSSSVVTVEGETESPQDAFTRGGRRKLRCPAGRLDALEGLTGFKGFRGLGYLECGV